MSENGGIEWFEVACGIEEGSKLLLDERIKVVEGEDQACAEPGGELVAAYESSHQRGTRDEEKRSNEISALRVHAYIDDCRVEVVTDLGHEKEQASQSCGDERNRGSNESNKIVSPSKVWLGWCIVVGEVTVLMLCRWYFFHHSFLV